MASSKCALPAWLLLLTLPPTAGAAVRVMVGPTPIPEGEAKSAGDITVFNERLAFALGVRSPVPYGVPRGAIVDVAPVVNGKIGRDCVVFADFIPNNWSAWPNTFQHVEVLERGPRRAVVRTVRDWGKVTVTTVYTLQSNADSVEIRATMSNGGAALTGLLSGLTLWPKGGYFFGVPGLAGLVQGKTDGALADRVVAYDEKWTVALHAPYAAHIADGSLDLYQLHALAPGESREFHAWLQVGSSGDLKPVIAAEIARKHLASGAVRGVVTGGDGKAVDAPVVVIEKQGKPFGWVLGRRGEYELRLPVGDYDFYATAKNYSQSERIRLQITAGAAAVRDFHGLQVPGSIEWSVADTRNGKPLDARISIEEGQKPLVEFLGRNTFFTELDRKGRLDVPIAPGNYLFTVSAGGGFLAERQQVELAVVAGQAQTAKIAVTPLFDPTARQWYSADLHHHADQAEAVTPPAGARPEAGDRHRYRDHRRDHQGRPAPRRHRSAGEPPVHPLWLFHQRDRRRGARRIQPGIRSHRDQCGGPRRRSESAAYPVELLECRTSLLPRGGHGYARCVARPVRSRAHIRSHRRWSDRQGVCTGAERRPRLRDLRAAHLPVGDVRR